MKNFLLHAPPQEALNEALNEELTKELTNSLNYNNSGSKDYYHKYIKGANTSTLKYNQNDNDTTNALEGSSNF